MRTRDKQEYIDEFMRRLDEGIVQEGHATIRAPLLDLDLVDIEVRTFVTTCERYPLEAPILAEEAGDISLLDAVLPNMEDTEDIEEDDPVDTSERSGWQDN